MSSEWKYVALRVENVYSTNFHNSPLFEISGVKYFLSFKPILSKKTSDDLLVIVLKRKNGYEYGKLVSTFIQDTDDDIRFIQKVSIDSGENALEKRVWEMNRRKFIEEGESVLEAGSTSNTVKFICAFGPIGPSLKDAMKILPFESIHLDRNSDCCESLYDDFGKLLETESFSDIVLKCGGQSFPAHKNILSARSGVFSAMFQHDLSESIEGVVNITDIGVTIFTDFLQYVYSGKRPDLSHDTAPLLYKAGDKYQVKALKKACAAYMVDNLKIENACEVLVLADSHSDNEFKDSVLSFINKEENCILKQQSWRKFHRDHPTLAQEVYGSCNE